MKTLCLLLSFSILLAGCYSQSSVTQDESVPDDETVAFYLKDGRNIELKPEEHTRTNAGYQVVGELVKYEVGTFFTDVHVQGRFEGMIHDSDIQKVTANKLNVVDTSIGVESLLLGSFSWYDISFGQQIQCISSHFIDF